MLKIPYSRRKRERLFHKLWVYLIVTSGVLILIFLSLGHNIQHNKETVPTTTEKEYPAFDDPFAKEPTSRNLAESGSSDSRARRFLPEENSVGRLLREEQDSPGIEDGRNQLDTLPKQMESVHSATIPLNVSAKIDPVLIKSGQYHYTNVIVHFDLKGAPPKTQYFLELLKLVARSGATGILMEWEDMFPWSGELKLVRNSNAYTVEEVQQILQRARELNLEVIPLVQTFGHMEWILKYEEFRKYRDDDRYPQVVCLGDQGAVNLIKQAIKQVVDVHLPYGIKHFHIGADEAFRKKFDERTIWVDTDIAISACPRKSGISKEYGHRSSIYGQCNHSLRSLGREETSEDLALKHIKTIALYAKSLTKEARILAWHDMFKSFPDSSISEHEIGDVVELVIWDYSESLITMPHESFHHLANLFPKLWASSAFKGADFPAATFANIQHYETNNLKWLGEMRDLRADPKWPGFEGIIITGWSSLYHLADLYHILNDRELQRVLFGASNKDEMRKYDHMASLCEIMPTGTPSMVLNTQIALIGADKKYDHVDIEHVSVAAKTMAYKILGCGNPSEYQHALHVSGCKFPGREVYDMIEFSLFDLIRDQEQFFKENHKFLGWLSPYNIAYNISQSWHLQEVLHGLQADRLHGVAKGLEYQMQLLFHNDTVDEFLFTKVDPVLENAVYYTKAIQQLQSFRTYERRFFKIHRKNFSEILREIP